MNIHKYELVAKLILDKEFREAMDKDIDSALEKSGYKLSPDMIARLKQFAKTSGIKSIENMKVTEVNAKLAKDLGLESRW